MAYDFVEGEVLLINKPLTWTSFDVVKKIRNKIKIKKIGHAGTLDPLATGLLILCTGKKTKTIDTIQAQEKVYTGTLVLGKTTPSIDLETDFDDTIYPTDHINDEMLHEATKQFVGTIAQIPPLFSAVKIDGQRAYKLARKGEEVEIKAREITIKSFEITRIELPEIDFKVICSKGTYIRSLVRDFGLAVNSGAYMSALCRERIGEYDLANALSPDEFIAQLQAQESL